MTVGILGMAFKARVRRHPLEPQLQAQAAAAVQGRPRALHRPVRAPSTPTSGRSTTCSRESDLLVIAAPHRQYADLDDRRAGRRHLEPAAATACGCDAARLGRHPRLQRGRQRSSRASTGSFDAVTLPCEVLVVYDSPDDTTRAVRSRSTRDDEPRVVPTLNTLRPRARPARSATGIEHADAPTSSSSRWPTAATTRTQIDELARLVERGVVVAAAVALHARRPAGRRPGR